MDGTWNRDGERARDAVAATATVRCYVRLVDVLSGERRSTIFRLRRNDSPSSVYMRSY